MDIQDIRNKLTSLKGEQKQAAIDAIKEILKGRTKAEVSKDISGGSMPPEIKIDPNLLEPTSGKKNQENANDKPNYDDPDDLLKKVKKHKNKNDNKDTNKQSSNTNSSEQNNNGKENGKEKDKKPQIGGQGDPTSDLRKAEDAYRKANEYKDEAEEKAEQAKAEGDSEEAEQAKAEGDSEEAEKQKELADKASNLADKASDLADGDELDPKEQARLKRIQDALHDIEIEKKIRDETENAVLSDREAQRRKEQQKKAKKFNTRSGGLAAFKRSIDKFMKDQLSPNREASWKRPNKRYPAETGIILKGKARVEKRNIPLLVVYFDQSGSWSKADVQRGLDAIESLNYYVKQHKLKLEVYYFAINIHDNPQAARDEGGTLSADKLVEDIKQKRPNNVVIMTDSDPDNGTHCPSVMVDGGVWLLFRDGSISKQLYKNVRGKMLNEVFEI